MNSFRISKYNPIYRQNGVYMREEWTSIGDIGRKYDNAIFTQEMYISVEQSYLSVIKNLCIESNVNSLLIVGLEDYNHYCDFRDGQKVKLNDILHISQDCLREKYWCKLESQDFYIHFGYDYYLYVGCILTCNEVKKITNYYNLYIEHIPFHYCGL